MRLFIPLLFSILAEFTALYFNFIDFSVFVGKPRAIYPPLYVKLWWTCNFSIRAVFLLCTCIFCSQDVNQPRSRYQKGLLFHELFENVHHNPVCFVKYIVMFRHIKIIKNGLTNSENPIQSPDCNNLLSKVIPNFPPNMFRVRCLANHMIAL